MWNKLVGRVLTCARRGIPGVGVELNSLLVVYSKYRAVRLGLSKQARFHRCDLFRTDLQPFNTAVIFGAESLMEILAPKLTEMRIGTQLVACRFPLPDGTPGWHLVYTTGEAHDAVWLYLRTKEEKKEAIQQPG